MSVLRHSREIPANPESVFSAIQDPARLARWWGPDGFTNTFHTFEFRQGGPWLFTMHGPDGADYPNQSEFLEIVPHSMVRNKHINLPYFELSISLEPNAAGTLVFGSEFLKIMNLPKECASSLRPLMSKI
jgi:hypothetical protein